MDARVLPDNGIRGRSVKHLRQEIKWGIPGIHPTGESKRELWTAIAPRWMIFTLSIMLAGVWGHYIFAIISLIRIKKAGEK